MSKSLGKQEWRELAHHVELDSGERYYLDSSWVYGVGFETVACRVNGNGVIYPGSEQKKRHYDNYEDMVTDHYSLLDNLEGFVNE